MSHGGGHTIRKNWTERVKIRQEKAQELKALRAELTPSQQLQRLDSKLGVGAGAVKERARLLAQISKAEVIK